jgi:lysozyme
MAPRKKNNPSRRAFIIAVLMAMLLLIGYQAYDWWKRNHPRFVRYREFGIEIPVSYSVHGIDVSRYQGEIDWKEVKEMNVRNIRLSFVFIKATEGLNSTDPYFKRNWKLGLSLFHYQPQRGRTGGQFYSHGKPAKRRPAARAGY